MSKKHPKGSIFDGEQRDLGKETHPANDEVKTNLGKRKHTSGKGGIPNLEIAKLFDLRHLDK